MKIPNFSQKNKESQGLEEYEEISEKKTSKLGYVLLIILALFLLIIGQKVFSDIKDIPQKPLSPTHSIEIYSDIEHLRNLAYPPTEYHQPAKYIYIEPLETQKGLILEFNDTDKKFGIDKKFKAIETEINSIISLNGDINDIKSEINSQKAQLEKLLMKYDVSLQEVIAEEEPLMDKPGIKTSITSLNNEISLLNQQLAGKTAEKDSALNTIEPKLLVLKNSFDEALEYYKNKQAFYNFLVFLLKLVFVLPLFISSLYFYFRLKKKNSPHTIIATAILTASSLLFLQIVLIFLYQILPMEWLIRVFRALMEIPALKYIIYYGSVLAVILIFGGIVYYIQKKVFTLEKIAIRRLKDNKCPNCSFTLDVSYKFCPKCGKQLKEKCPYCNNLKIKGLACCPFCGKK